MNEDRRHAVRRLTVLLERENAYLDEQQYSQVGQLLPAKQAALKTLELSSATSADPENPDDAVLIRDLSRLAAENRVKLRRALGVQERIMGIMADAARRMMETPLYGDQGARAIRRTGLAVAMIKQA